MSEVTPGGEPATPACPAAPHACLLVCLLVCLPVDTSGLPCVRLRVRWPVLYLSAPPEAGKADVSGPACRRNRLDPTAQRGLISPQLV